MQPVGAPLGNLARRRVQEILLRMRQLTLVLDGSLDRLGVPELRGNRLLMVLAQLQHQGPTRPRELQASSGLSSGGLTKLIDRMVALDLVERVDRGGAGDGRSVTVRLTRGGRRRLRQIRRAVDDARDDCRIVAKEIVQLAEAIGPRRAAMHQCDDLIGCLAQLGNRTLASLGDADDARPRDEYFALISLAYVDLHDECRPGALMEVLGFSSGGVTKLLDRLEHDGLITREYGVIVHDRRAVVVLATAAGQRHLHDAVSSFATHLDEVWSVMRWVAEGVARPARTPAADGQA